jgi:hypothetical protein
VDDSALRIQRACNKLVEICRPLARGRPKVDFRTLLASLDEQLYALVPNHDRTQLDDVLNRGHNALVSAKRGDAEAAGEQIKDTEVHLASLSLSITARTMATSMLAAQRAYCEFRQGHFNDASRLLETAFRADIALERENNRRFLITHRVQLMHNLAAVHQRSRNWKSAFLIGTLMMGYLETHGSTNLTTLGEPWGCDWEGSASILPRSYPEAMHRRFAEQMVTSLGVAHCCDVDPGPLSNELLQCANLVRSSTQVSEWLRFVSVAGTSDEAAVTAAICILQRGPTPSSPLWLSAARTASSAIDRLVRTV